MSKTASELPPNSVARFNKPGRRLPKMIGESDRGDGSAGVKPRIARQGYIRFLTMRDLDGRSRAAARCRELARELEVDLGGAHRLPPARRPLSQRAAGLAPPLGGFS